jgi:lysophospholipase L1-like esterase
MTRSLPLAATSLAVLSAILAAGCTVHRMSVSRELARQTEPFSVERSDATARLLIVGDSTAAGTGASSPDHSLPGQLAVMFPRVSIDNRSVVGARFDDVARQFPSAQSYDAVLVLAGGNDVIALTGEGKLRDSVERVTSEAAAIAPLVVLMPSGNVGNAPFFLPPWSWVMTARAKTLHEVIRETAKRHGATYVNLFKPKSRDPFALDPAHYHAADGLHPSDAGYAQWVTELLSQSPLRAELASPRGQPALQYRNLTSRP